MIYALIAVLVASTNIPFMIRDKTAWINFTVFGFGVGIAFMITAMEITK